MALDVSIQWTGGCRLTTGTATSRSRFGVSPTPAGLFRLTDGTGNSQANDVYETAFSLAASGGADTLLVDLKGGTSEKNPLGVALAFTAVKGVEVVITSPASTKSLRLGPQGKTDACQLWFQAVTANFYDLVRSRFAMFDEITGWAVGSSTKILALVNPSAVTVAGWLRVIGTK